MQRVSKLPLLVAGAGLALASCATAPPPRHSGHGDFGHRPAGGGRGTFISPMGEPFRGAPHDVLIAQWFDGADTDHDGRLSRAEFRSDALRFFRIVDTDGNGEISADEVRHYETDIAPEVRVAGSAGGNGGEVRHPGGGGGRGGGGGHHGGMGGGGGGGGRGHGDRGQPSDSTGPEQVDRVQGAGRFGLLNIPEPVASADTDFNRTVTKAEFLAAADRRFDLLDPDGNGTLTLLALRHR